MTEPEILVFPSLDQLSRKLADHFAALASAPPHGEKDFCAAWSGGETPRPFFERLSVEPVAEQIPWTCARLYQVDERAVPPDHPESNYRMIRLALLESVPPAAANFRRMEAERRDLSQAAREYEQVLENECRPPRGRPPSFDFILLGLGTDGHTASLFPGTSALAERKRWVVPNFVPRLNTYRMTLTYPAINAAREIVFMVAGGKKAEILRQVLEGPHQPEQWPAQAVQPVAGRVSWYVDREAAQALRKTLKNLG
jgi:6-phosphogluconolactonase